MKRIIFHIDQNCYFASVEMISRPELRDFDINTNDVKSKADEISEQLKPRLTTAS